MRKADHVVETGSGIGVRRGVMGSVFLAFLFQPPAKVALFFFFGRVESNNMERRLTMDFRSGISAVQTLEPQPAVDINFVGVGKFAHARL